MVNYGIQRPGGRKVLQEAASILVVAVVLTCASWLIRAPRPSLRADPSFFEQDLPVAVVDLDQARQLYDAGSHYFVDIRPVEPDGMDYIPGAFFICEESFDDDLREAADFIFPEDPLVLYGEGNLQLVAAVAARFLERGYENLQIMTGGIGAWRKAGGPLIENGNLRDE